MTERPLYRRHRLLQRTLDEDSTTWPASTDADVADRARRQLAKADAELLAAGAALLENYANPDDESAADALRRLVHDLPGRREGER